MKGWLRRIRGDRSARTNRRLVAAGLLLVALVVAVVAGLQSEPTTSLTTYRRLISRGLVASATIKDRSSVVEGRLVTGSTYRVAFPREYTDELTGQLLRARVAVRVDTETSGLQSLVSDLLGPLLIFGLLLWYLSRMAGGRLGLGRARTQRGGGASVRFTDVAGVDEAVAELEEVRDFLIDPDRYRRVGARLPRGVLLYGPPGTGKTLLAKAVATEANAEFFTISGSDFVEMFVGVGAARVRDLFRTARAAAPAIVFVDEIDAVGRHRGRGTGGGHDEREQTLNQLLVELDGFTERDNVILMAATNRLDILDPALLRPGRFDRHIAVDVPDRAGRLAILQVHTRGKPLADDVNLAGIARATPGFTGADLANVVNEAALLTGRQRGDAVTAAALTEAVERVLVGPERRSSIPDRDELWRIAVHEAGHAVVAHVLPGTDPVHKVSIVARGKVLGLTMVVPDNDRVLRTGAMLRDRIAMLFGGLVAERIVLGDFASGGSDDLAKATELAEQMVHELGMSESVGFRRVRRAVESNDPAVVHSDQLAARADAEIDALLREAERRADEMLRRFRPLLDSLSSRLMESETLSGDELSELLDETTRGAGGSAATP